MQTIKIQRRTVIVALAVAILAIPLAAYAGSVFDDVDDTNTHIDGITWMKDSEVSVGCGGNDYCPSGFVTRGQMGTFMHRLSGNASTTDPSVNADEVDGLHANELIRVAFDQSTGGTLGGSDGATQTALTATIEAPTTGFLVASASADVYSSVD
jgi:hypothetical protein